MCRFLLFGLLAFQYCNLFGQGEIDTLPKAIVSTEQTVAAYVYSNGWGVEYAYGKILNLKSKTVFSFDFAVIKDPKEIKSTNPASSESKRFVYGKSYSLISLHFGVGKQSQIYKKKDVGGIEIRYFYRFGPVFGFQKPVYYSLIGSDVKTRFDRSLSQYEYEGKMNYIVGINEVMMIPGAHFKFGSSFEFSRNSGNINAIDMGVSSDLFVRRIEIMDNDYSQFLFASLFLNVRFGKKYNLQSKKIEKMKRKSNKKHVSK